VRRRKGKTKVRLAGWAVLAVFALGGCAGWCEGNIAGKFTEVDFKLADRMETYWTNFARSGDPNGAGLPEWPRLEASSQRFMRFGVNDGAAASESPLRAAQCGLYLEWTGGRMRQGQ
jgi:hypothetical protein